MREFLEEAFHVAGIKDWSKYVVVDSKLNRPTGVYNLRGDSSKAAREDGLEDLVGELRKRAGLD